MSPFFLKEQKKIGRRGRKVKYVNNGNDDKQRKQSSGGHISYQILKYITKSMVFIDKQSIGLALESQKKIIIWKLDIYKGAPCNMTEKLQAI